MVNPSAQQGTVEDFPETSFCGSSLAAGVLSFSAERLVRSMKYFGLLFESLVLRDLRIYSDIHNGKVYHYRDSERERSI